MNNSNRFNVNSLIGFLLNLLVGLVSLVSTILFLLIVYIYITNPHKSEKHNEAYKLVAVLPLTGHLAAIGTPKQEAMELALENTSELYPDLEFEIEYQDSSASATNAVSIINQAIATDTPDSFFIDMTSVADACIPIVDEKNIMTFVGSAQAGITNRSDQIFRIFPGGDQEVKMIIGHLINRAPQGVFVLHSNELYGASVKKALLAHSADINFLGFEEYGIIDKDFRVQLAKAKASNAEVIAIFGYGNAYASILQQAQELEIRPENIVANLGAVNIGVTNLRPDLTEGMVFVGPSFALNSGSASASKEQREMVEAYVNKYKKEPDFRVAFIYDTIMLLARELNSTNDLAEVRKRLQNIQSYDGVSGKISITDSRDAQVDMVLGIYKDGRPTIYP